LIKNCYFVVFYFHCIARQSNNSLDEKLGFIEWITENNYVSPFRSFEAIADLVNKNVVAVIEGWLHRSAFDEKRLDQEVSDRDDDCQRNNDYLDCFPYESKYLSARRIFLLGWSLEFEFSHLLLDYITKNALCNTSKIGNFIWLNYTGFMKIFIGLGNPEAEYDDTRHNVGFVVVDKIAKESEAEFEFDKKINAEIAKTRFNNKPVILAKPHTFVNKSGEAAKKLKNIYKVKPEEIVVIHDDLDIEFGSFKVSLGKNSGGHKGVQNVIDNLKTKKFWRVRIGTANRKLVSVRHEKKLADKKEGVKNFVLAKFTPAEQTELKIVIKKALERLILSL